MTPQVQALIGKLRELLPEATQGEWCIESCGEKGDGSNMIGVAFAPGDEECRSPLSGWLAAFDELGREQEYYRDEEVAECAHSNRNANNDAAYIAACSPANLTLLLDHLTSQDERIRRLEEAIRPLHAFLDKAFKRSMRLSLYSRNAPRERVYAIWLAEMTPQSTPDCTLDELIEMHARAASVMKAPTEEDKD